MTREVKMFFCNPKFFEKEIKLLEGERLPTCAISYRDFPTLDAFIIEVNEAVQMDFDTVLLDLNEEACTKIMTEMVTDPSTKLTMAWEMED